MRELNLNGYIDDESWFGDEITPDGLHEQLYGKENNAMDDVHIRLNSYGGSCNAATRMFDDIRAYRKRAVFIVNDSTVKTLRKLKNGNGDYLWQASITAGSPDMLLGRPVYTSSFMPTVAAGAKTILFGDLGYYWVADREGRSFKRLNELYAATGQVGFLASERVDGKLILPEAVKVLAQKAS